MARVLVTNDDGIDSPGLHHLAQAARAAGHTVVVAAPTGDASGTSASITFPEHAGQLQVDQRNLPDLPDLPAYAVDAPPALITLIGVRGGFGPPPDVVLSGVNRGGNTGHAILHSGTVGAALTAAASGCPAMAFSLQLGIDSSEHHYWEATTSYLPELMAVLVNEPVSVMLNVNAPNLPVAELRGLREANLASFGGVETNVLVGEGYVQLVLSDAEASLEPDTDAAWLMHGYVTVSPVSPIFEMPDVGLHHTVARLNATLADVTSAS